MKLFTKTLMFLGVGLALLPRGAAADTIDPQLAAVGDNGGGTFTWIYRITLSNDSRIDADPTPMSADAATDHYGTIYDFGTTSAMTFSSTYVAPATIVYNGGLIALGAGSTTAADWDLSQSAFGMTPPALLVNPDTAADNVTYRYLGMTNNPDGLNEGGYTVPIKSRYAAVGPEILGYLSLTTTNGFPPIIGRATSQDLKNLGGSMPGTFTLESQNSGTFVPNEVPEPTSLILMGSGLASLYIQRRKK